MCDTLVALPSVTSDGNVLFAKNSDREPNEAQHIVRYPAKDYAQDSIVQCTYISIPQVSHTHAILLSKPFWIWGAEMGANDQGVVIGNEAVFTKVPQEKEPGLIGMDLLRLALERAATAMDALKTITSLIAEYGQAGNCGFEHEMVYHNSFLFCDRDEAWVLETAGREWAAEKVKDVRSISNALTIGNEWDLASDNLVQYAVDKKWCKGREDFHFAHCYSDFLYTTFSDAHHRQQCSMGNLRAATNKIKLQDMMAYLRSHSRSGNDMKQPEKGISGASVCMHAGWGPIRISQTTSSMIAELGHDVSDTFWVTNSAAPCLSIFLPLWFGESTALGETPGKKYLSGSDFWDHEVLHRSLLLDYKNRRSLIRDEQQAFEEKCIELAYSVKEKDMAQREALSQKLFSEMRNLRKSWIEKIQQSPITRPKFSLYQSAWKKFNQSCGIDSDIK